MNTLNIESVLAEKYKYKPLPKELSEKIREIYKKNIPSFLDISGSIFPLYTLNNTQICNGYDRIVIGDYGAFIEFSEEHITSDFIIKTGQEYRVNDDKYKKNIKYIWLTINDGSDVKIYLQKRKVSYADYKPKKYYVHLHNIF